jgi:transposase-like protein
VIVADARRRRTRAEKEAIVAELNASGDTVSAMARKHNIAASLLFRWRREMGAKNGAGKAKPDRSFVPVALPAPVAEPGPSCGGMLAGMTIDLSALPTDVEALQNLVREQAATLAAKDAELRARDLRSEQILAQLARLSLRLRPQVQALLWGQSVQPQLTRPANPRSPPDAYFKLRYYLIESSKGFKETFDVAFLLRCGMVGW